MKRWHAVWLAGLSALALADSNIQVMQPMIFATAPGAPTALLLLSLHNTGASADTLLGARTPLAGKVEMHSVEISGGVMTMRPLQSVPVPVGSLVEFKSGGKHLMLVGLAQPLVAGMVVPLTLTFHKAGELKINVPVQPMNAVR